MSVGTNQMPSKRSADAYLSIVSETRNFVEIIMFVHFQHLST